MNAEFYEHYQEAYERLAGRGERVLACAMMPLDGDRYPADFEFTEDNIPSEGVIC